MTTNPVRLMLLVAAAAVALGAAGSAAASDRTLKTTVNRWSHQLAFDARGISLSASRRHPKRMVRRARLFHAHALKARRAVAAQRPTTARGRRARRLALGAFHSYAVVGRDWTLSGQARIRGRKPAAGRYARAARRSTIAGNRLLVRAGRLLK
jgi:hypothetical protein